MDTLHKISGNILDVIHKRIFKGEIIIKNGFIDQIIEKPVNSEFLISPGLIDAHIHIESSMLTPQNFAAAVVRHGTVSLIADPHEIANVLGVEGITYMNANARKSYIKFFFGAPSCVPATSFENAGDVIGPDEIDQLFKNKQVHFLSEVMNYPGVINGDKEVLDKIAVARKHKSTIDGHAPGLTGKDLVKYVNAGIQTDHECVSIEEAIEKINLGMKILIREGSAAKNFETLFPLIDLFPEKVMFCSDDLHPDDLINGHINLIIKRALRKGANIFNVFRACTLNPVNHYKIPAGLLRIGDPADITVFENQTILEVVQTVCDGAIVYNRGEEILTPGKQEIINRFISEQISEESIRVPDKGKSVKIIHAFDGELLTEMIVDKLPILHNYLATDISKDYLKLIVVNRYENKTPAKGFIHGFGIATGAMASSVAHDCHNIIAVGTNDKDLCEVINWIIANKGGIAVHDGHTISGIALPIAGIISDMQADELARMYAQLNKIALSIGCKLNSPFMTLSFMALLVIPELKLSDKGLFHSKSFSLTDLYA